MLIFIVYIVNIYVNYLFVTFHKILLIVLTFNTLLKNANAFSAHIYHPYLYVTYYKPNVFYINVFLF